MNESSNFGCMICFPNGKINLGLNILSKRVDGFHNIESVIFPVELFDVLEFLPSKKFRLHLHGIPLPDKNENLVSRVWRLMSENYSLEPLTVNLLKSIPTGAGLGAN